MYKPKNVRRMEEGSPEYVEEEAFSEFIDGPAYDKVSTALFDLVRFAFITGWRERGHYIWQRKKMLAQQQEAASGESVNDTDGADT